MECDRDENNEGGVELIAVEHEAVVQETMRDVGGCGLVVVR